MSSLRKDRRRTARWERYIDQTSRTSVRHFDYPFGRSIKITPGYFGPRRQMRHRNATWYAVQRMVDEMFPEEEA